MGLKIYNNAVSTLAANIGTGDVTITIAAGDEALKFPSMGADDWFHAYLVKSDDTYEVVKVTHHASADTFTIARAQQGTTAKSFVIGDAFEMRLTESDFLFMHGAESAAVASASTVNLDASTVTGKFLHITGTTTITAVTLAQGQVRTVVFDGALTLTNGASLILPGGADIATVAGDVATFVGEGSAVTRCIYYKRAVTGGVLVRRPGASGTSVPSSVDTVIPWIEEQYDPLSMHDNAVNNSRLTVPAGVKKVRVSCQIYWNFSGTGSQSHIRIKKNGGDSYTGRPFTNAKNTSTLETQRAQSPVLDVASGDYFEVFVNTADSSASVAADSIGNASWFSMEIVE